MEVTVDEKREENNVSAETETAVLTKETEPESEGSKEPKTEPKELVVDESAEKVLDSAEAEEESASVFEKTDSADKMEAESTVPGKEGSSSSDDEKSGKPTVGSSFPRFRVFSSPMKERASPPQAAVQPKRRTSSNSFLSNDPYRVPEMSPETTLIEFISTSASFHSVKKQDIKQLEWDILKVFTNNVMPANAAAWYMAKRRFYLHNAWENQLLPFLLKKYPDKFCVRNQTVEFLDVCTKDIAKKKMNYMVNQGLYAYFSHKADEYGVYFFDPYYYEHTEPFHANLRIATNTQTGHRNKLLPNFFGQYKNNFVFTQHNPYLVTVSKTPTTVKINTTGIIVNMTDGPYGVIQFPSGNGTEKALFSSKALFLDAWPYEGDPMKLDAIKFDGYRIPGPTPPGRDYTWYAVLVWGGRKPSPKFCATKDDLTSNRRFNKGGEPLPSPLLTSPISKSPRKPDDGMIIGEVLEMRKNGAVVSMQSRDSDDKAFIPGWRFENLRRKGHFMTTVQGVRLAPKDLIGYYVDHNQKMEPYAAISHQIIVLKHAEEVKIPQSEVEFGSPNTRNGILRRLTNLGGEVNGNGKLSLAGTEMNTWKMLKKLDSVKYAEDDDDTYSPTKDERRENTNEKGRRDSSEYDSFDEAEDISDGELNFLRDGIMDFISLENRGTNDWRSITFLQKIMQETDNVINTRNLRRGVMKGRRRPVTPSSSHDSGHATSAEATPVVVPGSKAKKGTGKEAFWRMKKAFECLDKYNSDEDPMYDPSGDSEPEEMALKRKDRGGLKAARKNVSRENNGDSSSDDKSNLKSRAKKALQKPETHREIWVQQVLSSGVFYCPHMKKWVRNPEAATDDEDGDYDLPILDYENGEDEDPEDEIPEEELTNLLEDAKKELSELLPEESQITSVPEDCSEEKKSDDDSKEDQTAEDEVDVEKKEEDSVEKEKDSVEKEKDSDDKDEKAEEKDEKSEEKDEKSEDSLSKSKKRDVKKGPKTPYWLKYLLDEPLGSDYITPFDKEYYPGPVILETDCDYDEYSDGEIDSEEVEALAKEREIELTQEGICDCGIPKPKEPDSSETDVLSLPRKDSEEEEAQPRSEPPECVSNPKGEDGAKDSDESKTPDDSSTNESDSGPRDSGAESKGAPGDVKKGKKKASKSSVVAEDVAKVADSKVAN